MKKQKVLSSETEYHLLPSNQETITLLAIAAENNVKPKLKALAQTINDRSQASQDRDTASLYDALIMGSCFNEAKALLKSQKAEFGEWCRINCSVNDTQRRIYQRLDRNRNLIADQIDTGVVLSIKSALRFITQKVKKDKSPTNKLIGRVTLPFSDIEVSKDSKDKKNPYYCLIFRTTKRQDVANTYKTITGNDLPPDPPDEEPAEKIESVEEPTELAKLAA
jgi:hypothetical protein